MNLYYRDDNYKKIPIKLNLEYSDHAYKRLFERDLDKKFIESAIKKGMSSICRLKNKSDFKIYSYKYFLVIPCKVTFEHNKSLITVLVKTSFISPKPYYHKGEKLIYT